MANEATKSRVLRPFRFQGLTGLNDALRQRARPFPDLSGCSAVQACSSLPTKYAL